MQQPTQATDRKMQYRHQTASLHLANLHKAGCTDALQRRIQDHPQQLPANRTGNTRADKTRTAAATRTATPHTITQTTVITETQTMTEAIPEITAAPLQEVQAALRAAITANVQAALHTEDKLTTKEERS